MGLKEEINNKVKDVLDSKFTVAEVDYVPRIDNTKLTFGNTGLKFKGSVLFIDIRGSTKILNDHNKTTVAKLHMAFFHTIVKIANSFNGNVRSFNGDSALIFFEGDFQRTISDTVICAMTIKYMLSNPESGINQQLKKYSSLDFGIGVDHGEILCTKIGVGGEHNRDIFWIGNCVNKSTVLGDSSKSPDHIAISSFVYDNLLADAKFGTVGFFGNGEEKVDMWTKSSFYYNDHCENYYYTSWHVTL
jgi:class 3 adenylate cyclase